MPCVRNSTSVAPSEIKSMRTMQTRLRGAVLLFLLLWLPGCANKPVVRTETVTVKVPVQVALDKRLTEQEPEPKLAGNVVTNDDLTSYIDALKAWGRAGWGRVKKIAELQPKDGAP